MPDSKSPRFIQTWLADAQAERDAARAALAATPASVAPKFFYDRLGSHLFEAITELAEYYPTRTEAAIFADRGADMAKAIGAGMALVDLGAGNCAKAARLFPLLEPKRYVAVDISVEFLRDALRELQRDHPHVVIAGLGQDFSTRLEIPAELLGADRPVFFYPGSSIGNFTPDEALAFLRRVHQRVAIEGRGDAEPVVVGCLENAARLDQVDADQQAAAAGALAHALQERERLVGREVADA